MNKCITALLLVTLISGCSLFQRSVKPVQVEKRVQPIQVLHPPLPDPITWLPVEYKVLTVEIMRDIVSRVDSGELNERDAVFFAVTPEGYDSMAVNMAEVLRLIEGQKSVIIYYKTTVPNTIFLPKE